ncbi:DUF402 domain-containing protein [Actinoallomurus acanthiterrae]
MTVDGTGAPTFPQGSTVVCRDVLRGKVWSAAPFRVIQDTGTVLMLACWPGVEMVAPTTWIKWLRTGDDAVRKQAIPNLASGRWELDRWVWRDTTLLRRYEAGRYFSVSRFFDAEGRCGGWYVDFVRPFQRISVGIDTFDLLMDLVVTADLSSYRWKDEDEYAHARRLGLIDDTLHQCVETARRQVVSLIESRQGPFADDWSSWKRDPSWPAPALPFDGPTG